MSVHIVLDESALLSYAVLGTKQLAVAELLTSVHENQGIVGVPAACVLDAFAGLDWEARARLEDLLTDTDGVAIILPMLAGDTLPIAKRTPGMSIGQAHALAEARTHEAMLGTYHHGVYAPHLDEDDILDL